MTNLHLQLRAGCSTAALVAGSFFFSSASAQAQPADSIETVVVTGTSIRGTAPVGSSLITVGQQAIENVAASTVSEVLATVPALTGMGSTGRGANGNGGGGASVYIHQIGASAQNSTLVIMDGHRMPVSGTGNAVVDPNEIPQIMLERVEVLADGASSTYGSDAVSGVVNFITRKSYDGLEVHYQAQQEKASAIGQQASILAGQNWDKGGWIAAYSYSFEDNIKNTSLPKTNPLGQGARAAAAGVTGTTGARSDNFGNFSCSPATIQANGAGNIYLSPQSATNVPNNTVNASCSAWQYGDAVPSESRQNAMIKVTQNITNALTLRADALYSHKVGDTNVSRGTLQATAFQTGTQANPFYINPPGVTATKQTIRYDFDELFGPGAYTEVGDDDMAMSSNLDWNINDNWSVNVLAAAGRSDSFTGQSHFTINTGQATLALNGTNQSSGTVPLGTLASTALVGTQTVVTNLPLTTANALDVWNPAATNRTSQAVRDAFTQLYANTTLNHAVITYEQFRITGNGSLFDLWGAGPIKVAFGAERLNNQLFNYRTTAQNTGTTGISSGLREDNLARNISSGFVEALIPVVSADMDIPFAQKIEFDLSARHDDYSDIGHTTNPKVGFNWYPVSDLKVRGSWSTSFVAVSLIRDINPLTGQATAGVVGTGTPGSLPTAYYPAVTRLGIPGCTAASVSCDTSTLQGVTSSGNTINLTPQKGHGWTLGFDYAPHTIAFLEGLSIGASWWHVNFLGGATAASAQVDAFNPLLNDRIRVADAATHGGSPCFTTAEINAFIGNTPVNAVIPACVSTFTNTSTSNLINFWANGIDLGLGYHFDSGYGMFTVEDNLSLLTQFQQGFGKNQVPPANFRFDVKNTVGLNTTFPNVGTQMRAHVGWALDPFTADLAWNFTGAYKNVSATATTLIGSTSFGVYNGLGGDHVDAHSTFDLRLGYMFNTGYLGDNTVSLTVKNLLNTYPPYFNSAQGYDDYVASPLGRIVTVGFSAKL